MKNTKEILEPENTYHIYNRANGSDKMFVTTDNYKFFLERYQFYLSPYLNTYCYCLMPNHFHLLISVKDEKQVKQAISEFRGISRPQRSINLQGFSDAQPRDNLEGFAGPQRSTNLQGFAEVSIEKFLANQYSKFFNSYAKAFNKQENRKGSVFMKTVKRKLVGDSAYLHTLALYIHNNPVEAGLCEDPRDWLHSSYNTVLSDRPTFLQREEVLGWFGDKDNFTFVHQASRGKQ